MQLCPLVKLDTNYKLQTLTAVEQLTKYVAYIEDKYNQVACQLLMYVMVRKMLVRLTVSSRCCRYSVWHGDSFVLAGNDWQGEESVHRIITFHT